MNYTDMRKQFDQFMNDLATNYAGEFASNYDWYSIETELWFVCTDFNHGEWEFTEPDNDLIVSVLQANDRGVTMSWQVVSKKRGKCLISLSDRNTGEKIARLQEVKGWYVTVSDGKRELVVFVESGKHIITCVHTGIAIQNYGKTVRSMKQMLDKACAWPKLFDTYIEWLDSGKLDSDIKRYQELSWEYDRMKEGSSNA